MGEGCGGRVSVAGVAGRVIITFDVLEQPLDRNTPIGWGDLRAMIERNTPVADHLPVKDGLSAPIFHDSTWGTLSVMYEKF